MYTTTTLLAAIAQRSFMPVNQNTFTTAEILSAADEEMRTLIVPEILKLREEFFISYFDYTITANESNYEVPPRSVGLQVRAVQLIDSAGNVKPLTRINVNEASTTNAGTDTWAFYLLGNQIYPYPKPSSAIGTLRVYYPLEPSKFVETSAIGVITAINTSTNVVTCASVPSSWATGDSFDFTRIGGGQEPWAIDNVSTLVSGTSITFSALPSDLAVGDYVSLAEETALVQIPSAWRDILAQAVAENILRTTSQPGAERAEKTLSRMLNTARVSFDNRTIGNPRVVCNRIWG